MASATAKSKERNNFSLTDIASTEAKGREVYLHSDIGGGYRDARKNNIDPKPKRITVDIFGFNRAAARYFIHRALYDYDGAKYRAYQEALKQGGDDGDIAVYKDTKLRLSTRRPRQTHFDGRTLVG